MNISSMIMVNENGVNCLLLRPWKGFEGYRNIGKSFQGYIRDIL